MKNNWFIRIVLILIFLLCAFNMPVPPAEAKGSIDSHLKNIKDNDMPFGSGDSDDSVTIGDSEDISTPEKETDAEGSDKTPTIRKAILLGDFNKKAHGVEYFKNITISLVGDHLTDDHFLSEEGLHWSNKTKVEVIRGKELGDFDFSTLPYEVPNVSAKAYSISNGDSGRITYVGKTKSGIELDLIWTVLGSDKDDWEANSGYANNKVKGLAFTGEQFFPGASGNSISVLYNNASNLGLQYQIVKHGTTVEQPVIVSFISTDIDSAQGVETDLANILEVIPPDSHLVKQDGIIYDTTAGAVNLNGSKDLPRGGYLGASFSAKFNYVFYSPAPKRANNSSYSYPKAVRYDLFGSSLQAKLLTKLQQHISVRYVDTKGNELKPEEHYRGFRDKSYNFSSLEIAKHQLVDIEKNTTDLNHPVVTFIYSPVHTVTLHFVDESGRKLAADKTYTIPDGKEFSYVPLAVAGYDTSGSFARKITKDTEYSFIYKKTVKPRSIKPTSRANLNFSKQQGRTISALRKPGGLTRPQQPRKQIINGSKPKGTIVKPGYPSLPRYRKEPTDPFLLNTSMNKRKKKIFLDYIKEIGRQARKKYGNDKHKVNHAIANAIAYPVYQDNFLQSLVNDFGDKPNVNNYTNIAALLQDIHDDGRSKTNKKQHYKIDFPHFATTLASAEKSGWGKETVKWIAGFSPSVLLGISPKDNFFHQNSLTGDLLTIFDKKDLDTDIDAIIFRYHPDYKNLSLDEAIIKYYHMENLDLERRRLYREVLKEQAGPYINPEEQQLLNLFFASLALGGIGLTGLGIYQRLRKQREEDQISPSEDTKNILSKIGKGFESFFKDPLGFIGANLLGSIANAVADSIVFGSILVRKGAGLLYDNVIKPVVKKVNRAIIQPLNKYVFKPVYRHTIKPVLAFTENKILKPVVRKVVKPLVKFVHKNIVRPVIKHVVKPVYRFVRDRVAKPIYRHVVKPVYKHVVKPIYKHVVKPVYRRVVKPIYKKLIKPVVTPIYRKVIRPAARFVRKKIFKPAARFVRKKVVKPVARFLKRLWG